MKTKSMTRLITVIVVTTVLCCAQQAPQSQKVGVEALLDEVRSDDGAKRYEAFNKLSSDPVALRDARVRNALLELLDRENRDFEAKVREIRGGGQSAGDDDGAPEYMEALVGTVESFADQHDPHQICILVKTGYMPISSSPAENAIRVKAAMPCLVRMSENTFMLDRIRAAGILARLSALEGILDPPMAQEIQQLVVRALHDPAEAVRSSTVDALGDFGTEDMIPALRQVAESDPALNKTKQTYWIREDAATAITEIRKRTGHN